MKNVLLPIDTAVVVTPRSTVRGPSYRGIVVGHNLDRTKLHIGAQLGPGVYARGGSWAFPDEVQAR